MASPETGLPDTGLPDTGLPETGLPETGPGPGTPCRPVASSSGTPPGRARPVAPVLREPKELPSGAGMADTGRPAPPRGGSG